jgi:glycosyltransferase involved in cell wall biosynthesis
MRKILIIAYYFPPIQSSGVYRPLKFVKYLREFGWEPVVLTVNPVCVHSRDDELLNDLPKDIVIERTPQLDFYRLVRLFKRQKVATQACRDGNDNEKQNKDRETHADSTLKRMLSGLKRHVALFTRGVFFVPDDEVPWLPVAVARAVKLAKREGIDAVMTTAPPQSAHLVGLFTKWATGLPWIVDFRDLWMDEFDFYEKPYGRWRRPIERFMEKQVLKRADRVINISRGESLTLQSEYNYLPAGKFHVIHNGFDLEDFNEDSKVAGSKNTMRDRLRITYMGTLYPSTADEFFEALSELYEVNPLLGDQVEFRFIGHFDSSYIDMTGNCSFSNSLNLLGMRPHDEAVREMCDSDVLLVLLGGNKMKDTEVPGKIFEYMGTGKPILALVRQGDVSSILEGSNLAFTVNPDNREEIKETLLNLVKLWQQGELHREPNIEYINRFSRKELTGKLSSMLDELVT